MPRHAAAPQVPGESAPVEAVDSAETVVVEKSQLDALLSQVADLTAKVRGIESNKPAKKVSQSADLPDADNVDPAKIKTPVLTKQGWIVPDSYGSNPAIPKAF